MRVLALDTSTTRAFVAAVEDGSVCWLSESEKPTMHGERLIGMVQEVLARSGWGQTGVELVAVGRGPGSFTGVRVGVATAKGWAYARGLPVVGVVSLDAMAHAALRSSSRAGAAFLDARKGEVFAAIYDGSGQRVVEPSHLPLGRAGQWLTDHAARCGLALAWVVGEVASSLGLSDALVRRTPETDAPSPQSLALLAERVWGHARHDELIDLDPLYVRPPDITVPTAKSTAGAGSA